MSSSTQPIAVSWLHLNQTRPGNTWGGLIKIVDVVSSKSYILPSSPSGWISLDFNNRLPFEDGHKFTVTFNNFERDFPDSTVLTYVKGSSGAAEFLEGGTTVDPSFKYTGLTHTLTPSIKVDALYVKSYAAKYGGHIEATCPALRSTAFGLAITPGEDNMFPLQDFLPEHYKDFLVGFKSLGPFPATWNSQFLKHESGVSVAAEFKVGVDGVFTFTGRLVPSSDTIKAKSVFVDLGGAVYGADIQLVSTTSGDVFPLGSIGPGGQGSFPVKGLGLPAGQEFTVTLQAHEGGAKAEITKITYDEVAAAAAAYAASGSLKEPEFKYVGVVAA